MEKIEKWDDKNFFKNEKYENFSAIICGSRRSGKSYLLKYLFKKFKFNDKFDYICVICGSSELNNYQEYIKGDLFFDEFEGGIIDRLFLLSEYFQQNGKSKKFLVILDDTISNDQKFNEALNNVFSRGRHANISLFLTTQKLSMSSTISRTNCDIVFLGCAKSSMEKKAYISNFLDGEIEFPEGVRQDKALIKIIKENTQDFNFLVVDYSGDNILFKYRAE